MIQLKQSRVIFNEDDHTYYLGDKQLYGITGLLHDKLFPNTYANIPKATLEAAAKRGTMIHKLTELYDSMGVSDDTVKEVKGYARLKTEGGFSTIESEYIVTDGEYYASAIDVVWTKDDTSVYLVDKKTTSQYYGDYVSWQLSIYAYLFEMMNPDVNVAGLYGCWLRDDKAKLYPAHRHSDDEVRRLLQSGIDGSPFVPTENPLMPSLFEDELSRLAEIDRTIKSLTEEKGALLASLEKGMKENELDKVENNTCVVSIKAAYERTTLDANAFKADYADLYEKYKKVSKVKESITFKLK